MSNAENTEPGDAKLDVSSSHSADKQEEASGSNNDVSIRGNSENEGKKKLKKEDKPPTKVVIRRLPPTMEEEAFLQAVSPLPEHDHFEYIKGDFSLGPHSFSRCYINFNNQEDIFSFTETFDQYVFLGAKGQEYPALVEYAPFQRIPRAKPKKKDPLAGTIETDPFFIAFKKLLEEEAERNAKAPSGGVGIQSYVEAEAAPNEAAESTPLLDFLKHKKMEKARIREEKREERKKKELDRKMRQLALREKKSEAQKENFEEVENISQVHVLQSKDKKKELEKSDFDRKADDKERNPKFKKEERDKGFKEKLSPRSKETKFKSSNKNYSEDKGRKKEDKKKEGRQDAGEVPEDINRVSESSATKDGISDTGPATRRRSRGEKNKSNTVKERERKRLCEFMAKKQAKKKNCSGEENADGMTDAERANSGLTNERLVNHEDQATGPSNASPKRRSSLESGEAKKAEEHFNEKRRNSADSGSSKSASKEIPGGECVSGKDSDRLCKSSRENNPEKQGSRGEKTKDPRTDRRIRNKDRPSIQIYRPGMGKFSKQRLEKEKVLGSSTEIDSPSHSPSPTPKPNSKQSSERHDLPNH